MRKRITWILVAVLLLTTVPFMAAAENTAFLQERLPKQVLKTMEDIGVVTAGFTSSGKSEIKGVNVRVEQLVVDSDVDALNTLDEEEDKTPLKREIAIKVLMRDPYKYSPLLAGEYESGALNLRQVMTIEALAKMLQENTIESLVKEENNIDFILNLFIANKMGIGATAKALELSSQEVLQAVNASFKKVKRDIQTDFKDAQIENKGNTLDSDKDSDVDSKEKPSVSRGNGKDKALAKGQKKP